MPGYGDLSGLTTNSTAKCKECGDTTTKLFYNTCTYNAAGALTDVDCATNYI
jgi:hypothetical protein